MRFEWILRSPKEENIRRLIDEFKIPEILAILLVNRGIVDSKDVSYFLHPESAEFIDPYKMKGVKEGVELLLKSRGDKILIYGDYDVDGVTGTALLYKILKKLGWNVGYYIPNRMEEGYGLTMGIMEKMADEGFGTLITVDCGITSVEEIKHAKSLGIKVIITDHHEPKDEIPPADVVVNPKIPDDPYPFKGLAGVGVAFKFLKALIDSMGEDIDLEEYLDLVALGTVGDIVPIVNENRIIVKKGLEMLRRTKNIGLRVLMESIGIDMKNTTVQDIGFKLVPRLNAAGRVDDASIAIELLLTEDESRARELAEILIQHNLRRQSIGNEIFSEALKKIEELKMDEDRAIVIASKGWHPGVIGIVASKLINRFYKPTFLISVDEEGTGKGSARSIEGVNMMELLSEASDLLEEYGGHRMAAGFTIREESIPEFRRRMNKILSKYPSEIFKPKILIDAELSLKDLNEDLLNIIEILGPYGQNNPEPIFVFRDLNMEHFKLPQSNSDFVKMIVSQDGRKMEVVSFNGFRFEDMKFFKPQLLKIDLVGSIRKRFDHGIPIMNIQMIDMKLKVESPFLNEDGRFVAQILRKEHNVSNSSEIYLDDVRDFMRDNLFKNELMKKLEEPSDVLMLVDPRTKYLILCGEVLRNIESEKRLLILSSTNLELYHVYNTLKRFFGGFMDYRNSMNNGLKKGLNSPVVFSTLPYFSRYSNSFSNFDSLILVEPFYYNYESHFTFERMKEFLEWLEGVFERILFVGSVFTDKRALELERIFDPRYVVKEINRRKEIGLIDLRNTRNKMEYIENLIRENETLVIVVTSPQKTIEIAKKLGKKFPDLFKVGGIVLYNEYLDPSHMKRIENMLKKNRVKVVVMTPNVVNVPLQDSEVNVIYYDAPRFPDELLTPVYAVSSKMVVIHLLFGEDDVGANMELINSLFPDRSRILQVWGMVRNLRQSGEHRGGENEIAEVLFKRGIIYRKSHLKIFMNILKDVGAFEKGYLNGLENSLRYEEGVLERHLVRRFGNLLVESNTKEFFKFISDPSCVTL